MKNLSLRLRIFISYFVLIAVAAVVLNTIATRQIQDATEGAFFDSFDEKTEIAVGATEDWIFELIENDFEEEDVMRQEMTQLAQNLEISITLLNLEGDFILYDTETGEADVPRENTFDEEVDEEAFDEEMFEDEPFDEEGIDEELFDDELFEDDQFDDEELTDEQFAEAEDIFNLIEFDVPEFFFEEETGRIYRSHYAFFEEDEPFLIVRIGESFSELEQTTRTQTWVLRGTTFGVGLLLLILLGSWLANALTRPLTQLRTTAQAMAAGKLDTRADTQAPPEISLLAEDFNQMATAVEKMVAEQRAFASNAAHELRTPLTAIRLRTETLLEDEPDFDIQQRYIAEIHTEAERLSHLVEDLRLLSRVDSQRLEVGHERVNVKQLLETVQREFMPTIREKNLTYTMHITGEPVIQASVNHMRVIVRNVIENAIKYTSADGRIEVRLKQDSNQLQFTVQDTGIGIAAEDLPHLFNRFFRADKAHGRKIAGSGLGLSLVSSVVTLYGGTITVESKGIGFGTAVTVSLPFTVR